MEVPFPRFLFLPSLGLGEHVGNGWFHPWTFQGLKDGPVDLYGLLEKWEYTITANTVDAPLISQMTLASL